MEFGLTYDVVPTTRGFDVVKVFASAPSPVSAMSDARTEKNQTVVYNPRKRPVYILGESLRPRGVSTPENVLKKTTLRTKKTRGWDGSVRIN